MKARLLLSTEPMAMTCAACNGRLIVYPDPLPKGTAVCLDGCSPAWLVSFAAWKHEHRADSASAEVRP